MAEGFELQYSVSQGDRAQWHSWKHARDRLKQASNSLARILRKC